MFLREYDAGRRQRPVSTGKLLGGADAAGADLPGLARRRHDGSIGTWAAVKKQAAEKLGLLLRTAT